MNRADAQSIALTMPSRLDPPPPFGQIAATRGMMAMAGKVKLIVGMAA